MQIIESQINMRVEWIKEILRQSKTDGIVFGASGGKDSILVGALSSRATKNVTGLIMPCESIINYSTDKEHAVITNKLFNIQTIEADLTEIKKQFRVLLEPLCEEQNEMAYANINPRLRMISLYNYAQRKNYLVAGTSNRSERKMGYFTKWGDGACDFNPIADLTVREVYKYLEYFNIPEDIIKKAPSAGLYENQTDEEELGITYKEIDDYLLDGRASLESRNIILQTSKRTAHKRNGIMFFNQDKILKD